MSITMASALQGRRTKSILQVLDGAQAKHRDSICIVFVDDNKAEVVDKKGKRKRRAV